MAMWLNGDVEGLFHKGSNAPEFFHSLVSGRKGSFDYLKKESVFLERLPVIATLQKIFANIKRHRLIKKRHKETMQYDPRIYDINEQLLQRLEKLVGLDYLRDNFRNKDKSPHHYLFFDNTPKSVYEFLHGFIWQNAVIRITGMDDKDIEVLGKFVVKHKAELEASNGKWYNETSLRFLQSKIKYKISIDKLRLLIFKYMITDDDLIKSIIQELNIPLQEDDYDEFDEYDYDEKLLIENDYNTSPLKSKKKSELCNTHPF